MNEAQQLAVLILKGLVGYRPIAGMALGSAEIHSEMIHICEIILGEDLSKKMRSPQFEERDAMGREAWELIVKYGKNIPPYDDMKAKDNEERAAKVSEEGLDPQCNGCPGLSAGCPGKTPGGPEPEHNQLAGSGPVNLLQGLLEAMLGKSPSSPKPGATLDTNGNDPFFEGAKHKIRRFTD